MWNNNINATLEMAIAENIEQLLAVFDIDRIPTGVNIVVIH